MSKIEKLYEDDEVADWFEMLRLESVEIYKTWHGKMTEDQCRNLALLRRVYELETKVKKLEEKCTCKK